MSNGEDRIQLELDELRRDVDQIQEVVYGADTDRGLRSMVYNHESALIAIANEMAAIRLNLANELSLLRRDTKYAIVILATILTMIFIGTGLSYFVLFERLIELIRTTTH